MPSSINDTCAADDSAALSNWLNSLPPGTTAELPPHGCLLIDGTLNITGTSGLFIQGNQASLEQESAPPVGGPIVELTSDTNLTVVSLNIVGAYDRTAAPVNEGNYGIVMKADDGVSLVGVNVSDVQGDGLYLSPPYDLDTVALNQRVSLLWDTFSDIGYHGLTVESVNGLTINQTAWTNLGTDAMDFEVDDYPSGAPNPGSNIATFFAQDNILIENSTWTNFGADWLASLQGQVKGCDPTPSNPINGCASVQEQHVTLTGNTVNADSPLVQISGASFTAVPATYYNLGLTITNNKFGSGYAAKPVYGGSIGNPNKPVGFAMAIYNVAGLVMTGNTFDVYDGTCDPPSSFSYFCETPYVSAADLAGVIYSTVEHNDFSGAYDILWPVDATAGNAFTECGNTYGVNGAQVDKACP